MIMQRYVEKTGPTPRIHENVDAEETEIPNIEDYLERICIAMEEKSRSTAKTEVEECINILNQMEEIPCGSELYLFSLNLFARHEKRLIFSAIKEADLPLKWLEREKTS